MRTAELMMAVIMGLCSVALMVKSAELPIGWIAGEGPGAGAFPFWLAFGMLVCCGFMVFNWARRTSPPSRSTEPFMDGQTVWLFVFAAGTLTAMIGLIHVIGVYFAVPLFLLVYMRGMGRHSWLVSGSIALATPIVAFFFFEGALTITLPKGHTEPLFYPLYEWIY